MRTELYDIFYSILCAAAVIFASVRFMHMLQLESYQGKMYVKWLSKHKSADAVPYLMTGVVAVALSMCYPFFYYREGFYELSDMMPYAADAGYLLLLVFIGFAELKKPKVKPFVVTGRIVRLAVVLGLLAAIFTVSELLLQPLMSSLGGILLVFLLRYVPGYSLPLFVLLAYFITYPVESAVKKWYFNDAKKKLGQMRNLKKIGITGSFGKTSTKFILGTILSERFNTLFTPSSFNTSMGVTRVIRERLNADHEVFIAEMGARYKGDIKELCELVKPGIGIITSIGKQHLATFGSFENVIATKSELISALPEDGAAVLNGDNEYCRRMADVCSCKTVLLFGLDSSDLFMRATDIRTGENGSSFTLSTSEGESVKCSTKLLGRHNILNITGAAACAKLLGMSLEEIANGISKLEPVEHRLQLIPGPVTVIDDAFNANPEGVKYALDVLREFKGRRIIVTPGMVELGEEEDALNREFGRSIADAADIAILVGKGHVEPIREGLLSKGFDPDNIIKTDTLKSASEVLPLYTTPGCVVLFENDLPDNYNE
ncbi:MAG: UDP-N-acetylmuramoyl-tripeptide--D-alanyl-D-alanine ligase [Firmicutes bacterium ADurb.Bin182]|nr:MAG: UDP-N-acetylmuramoyl-tripeptide--D-alanyl-D-alanine ligase [Firmicutes bacterium ADurb.Bin182]